MGRLTAVVQDSVPGVPTQARTFSYDANHRIRYQRMGPVDANFQPVGVQIVTETQYDRGGRVQRRIMAGGATDGSYTATGIVMNYSYANGDRDVTESLPSGTRSVLRYADGRIKSISGAAVVTPESYSYSFDASGRRQTTLEYSTEANKRPRIVALDWLGRVVEERINGVLQPNGTSKPIVVSNDYGSRGLLDVVKVMEMTGSTPLRLSADRRFDYDEFGSLRSGGLDLNSDHVLQEASLDRFNSSETKFHQDLSGAWWIHTIAKVYHTDNSATAHNTSRYVRLTGFGVGQTMQVDSYDFYNNRTYEEVTFSNTAHSRVTTRSAVDGTRTVTTTVGGLVTTQSAVNDSGTETHTATSVYDEEGRLRQSTSPRGVVTRHEYHLGTNQLWRTFEDRNEQGGEIRVAVLSYESSGRVSAATDAKGNVTTTTYYPTGQIKDRGGNGAHPLHHVYNGHGQLKELWTFRNGPTGTPDRTIWDYDPNTGWLKSKQDAVNPSVAYSYTNASPYKIITRLSLIHI